MLKASREHRSTEPRLGGSGRTCDSGSGSGRRFNVDGHDIAGTYHSACSRRALARAGPGETN
jgi:hypothetical protein